MAQKSLGLIETAELTAAIEAADAAVKSANVTLIGYELTKGGGYTVVKVEGDVGAVKAAIDAARTAAAKVGMIVSTKVIARPAPGIECLIRNVDTVGQASSDAKSEQRNPTLEKTEQMSAVPEKTDEESVLSEPLPMESEPTEAVVIDLAETTKDDNEAPVTESSEDAQSHEPSQAAPIGKTGGRKSKPGASGGKRKSKPKGKA